MTFDEEYGLVRWTTSIQDAIREAVTPNNRFFDYHDAKERGLVMKVVDGMPKPGSAVYVDREADPARVTNANQNYCNDWRALQRAAKHL